DPAGQPSHGPIPPSAVPRPKKPAPGRGTGTTAALDRKRTFPSAEGHRTRSAGQASWLRILAAPRLPGHPSGDLESSSPLQWRDRAGFAAPRESAGRAPASLLLPANREHPTDTILSLNPRIGAGGEGVHGFLG